MQQRAKLQAWQVTSNPEAVLGRHPVTNGSDSMVDLHDIDTRVTKDLNWKLGQARAQINRPASHYRKRYRPGKYSYHRCSITPPVLTAAAISLCFVAALLNPALGTSALATTTAVVGLQKAKQQIQARRHKTATTQLPQTVPLSHHCDSLRDKANQERDKNNQNIAQWEQQESHHQIQWISAEQKVKDFEIAALATKGISPEKTTAKTAPQLMMIQAKRARSMATCAEVILVDEGDTQITALVDSGACLSAAPLTALHRSQHLINKEQARQLCTANGRPMAMAGELQVRLRFKGSPRILTISMQIISR